MTEPTPEPTERDKRTQSLEFAMTLNTGANSTTGGRPDIRTVLREADMIYQYIGNGRWEFPDDATGI